MQELDQIPETSSLEELEKIDIDELELDPTFLANGSLTLEPGLLRGLLDLPRPPSPEAQHFFHDLFYAGDDGTQNLVNNQPRVLEHVAPLFTLTPSELDAFIRTPEIEALVRNYRADCNASSSSSNGPPSEARLMQVDAGLSLLLEKELFPTGGMAARFAYLWHRAERATEPETAHNCHAVAFAVRVFQFMKTGACGARFPTVRDRGRVDVASLAILAVVILARYSGVGEDEDVPATLALSD